MNSGRPISRGQCQDAPLKIRKDAVFAPKPVWRGATREHTPHGSGTDEQKRQTGLGAKTLRATVLLPLDFVVALVTARYGDAPTAPPRPKPKSPVAAPFPILRQALRVFLRAFHPADTPVRSLGGQRNTEIIGLEQFDPAPSLFGEYTEMGAQGNFKRRWPVGGKDHFAPGQGFGGCARLKTVPSCVELMQEKLWPLYLPL